VCAFIFGAFDTSSTTITNTLYELALNQSVQDRLREEIKSVRELNNRNKSEEITYEDINSMSYLDAILKGKFDCDTKINQSKKENSWQTWRNCLILLYKYSSTNLFLAVAFNNVTNISFMFASYL